MTFIPEVYKELDVKLLEVLKSIDSIQDKSKLELNSLF